MVGQVGGGGGEGVMMTHVNIIFFGVLSSFGAFSFARTNACETEHAVNKLSSVKQSKVYAPVRF